MRVLVVCLLAVLGCSVAEGAIVSKCELKQKLTDKLLGPGIISGLDMDRLARIVCHVEYAAGFNTSKVEELTIPTENIPQRKRRNTGIFGLAEYEQPSTRNWILYGLFQLSNYLVCNDGRSETHNVCQMECNKLTDDNIDDDLDCVLKLFLVLVEDGYASPYFQDLIKMIRLIFQDECRGVQPSEYFKECA